MIKDIDQRESNMMNFIDAKNKITQKQEDIAAIQMNPELKLRKLNNEANNAVGISIDTLLGRIYRDALPFDDPKRNAPDDEIRQDIQNYISSRTNGNGSEWYIREAIKKTNSSTLKGILEEAIEISKDFYSETAKNIGTISMDDLNFNPNSDPGGIDKIYKNLELNDISEIIQNNVQKAIQDEKDRVAREDEFNKKLEDSLANNNDVVDEPSMEAAIDKIKNSMPVKVYQPSLLEAIVINKSKYMTEGASENCMTEAIREFTMLNMTKALKLESFNLTKIKDLANSYVNC